MLKEDPIKYCKFCGKQLFRKRFNGRLEDLGVFKRRKYCSVKCMKLDYLNIGENNSNWSNSHTTARIINKEILKKNKCELCEKTGKLDVHHIDGNFQNNSIDNLQILCRSCHNKIHKNKKVCKVCGEKHRALGYCNKHYIQYKKYGYIKTT
ncbi:HNH endonuclease signature motif containing protein [Clostridium perfringens]|uniref:HNH endonuclease signature motif containing protein n=1 Tax=Clostridium perfringens TaxID=1502 RepID=UPI001F06F4F5|nr:HNH endonuclease signature motif containing protein [Clostridium perfringens]MCH1964374.1 HNH endonuclease [Clostridium perfringens]